MLHHVARVGNLDGDISCWAGSLDTEEGFLRADVELNELAGRVQFAEHLLQELAAHDHFADDVGAGEVKVQTLLGFSGLDLRVTDNTVILQQEDERMSVPSVADLDTGTGVSVPEREAVETLEDDPQIDGE